MCGEEGVDLGVLGFGETEGCRGDDAFDLFGVATAYDGCGDSRVVERPRDGDDAGGDFVARADLFELVGYSEIAGEEGFLVVLRVAAEVVGWKVGDGCRFSGRQR